MSESELNEDPEPGPRPGSNFDPIARKAGWEQILRQAGWRRIAARAKAMGIDLEREQAQPLPAEQTPLPEPPAPTVEVPPSTGLRSRLRRAFDIDTQIAGAGALTLLAIDALNNFGNYQGSTLLRPGEVALGVAAVLAGIDSFSEPEAEVVEQFPPPALDPERVAAYTEAA